MEPAEPEAGPLEPEAEPAEPELAKELAEELVVAASLAGRGATKRHASRSIASPAAPTEPAVSGSPDHTHTPAASATAAWPRRRAGCGAPGGTCRRVQACVSSEKCHAVSATKGEPPAAGGRPAPPKRSAARGEAQAPQAATPADTPAATPPDTPPDTPPATPPITPAAAPPAQRGEKLWSCRGAGHTAGAGGRARAGRISVQARVSIENCHRSARGTCWLSLPPKTSRPDARGIHRIHESRPVAGGIRRIHS